MDAVTVSHPFLYFALISHLWIVFASFNSVGWPAWLQCEVLRGHLCCEASKPPMPGVLCSWRSHSTQTLCTKCHCGLIGPCSCGNQLHWRSLNHPLIIFFFLFKFPYLCEWRRKIKQKKREQLQHWAGKKSDIDLMIMNSLNRKPWILVSSLLQWPLCTHTHNRKWHKSDFLYCLSFLYCYYEVHMAIVWTKYFMH